MCIYQTGIHSPYRQIKYARQQLFRFRFQLLSYLPFMWLPLASFFFPPASIRNVCVLGGVLRSLQLFFAILPVPRMLFVCCAMSVCRCCVFILCLCALARCEKASSWAHALIMNLYRRNICVCLAKWTWVWAVRVCVCMSIWNEIIPKQIYRHVL